MKLTMSLWAKMHAAILHQVRSTLNWDMPIQQWQTLCEIAANPGIDGPTLKKNLNMTAGSLSRNIQVLSKFRYKNRYKGTEELRGYDLITIEIDAYETRSRTYRLNKKGEQLMKEVFSTVEKFNLSIDDKKGGNRVAL